jgi:hypothetical protein
VSLPTFAFSEGPSRGASCPTSSSREGTEVAVIVGAQLTFDLDEAEIAELRIHRGSATDANS